MSPEGADSAATPDVRRIAMITMCSVPLDPNANARKISAYLRDAAAKGARLALFPELALCANAKGAHEAALARTSPILLGIASDAADMGLAASVGFFEKEGDKRYVAQAFLQDGEVRSVYRKMFCCEAGGSDGDSFETVDWDGVLVGTTICWDLHFPLVTREMAKRGALIILHPSAYMDDPREPFNHENHNVYLPRCRARENGVFFFHLNASGPREDKLFFGNAIVVDPEGRIMSRIDFSPHAENMLVVDVDLNLARHAQGREWMQREIDRTGLRDRLEPGR